MHSFKAFMRKLLYRVHKGTSRLVLGAHAVSTLRLKRLPQQPAVDAALEALEVIRVNGFGVTIAVDVQAAVVSRGGRRQTGQTVHTLGKRLPSRFMVYC